MIHIIVNLYVSFIAMHSHIVYIDGSQSINDIFKHIANKINIRMKEIEDIER